MGSVPKPSIVVLPQHALQRLVMLSAGDEHSTRGTEEYAEIKKKSM
jgi:hypothetical protein